MAKTTNLDEAMDKYGNDGGEYFKLKDDKDSEVVRFLHEGPLVRDKDWTIAHEVEIDGKKRWVQCPEEDDCVLCGANIKQQLKLFLQLVTKFDGKRKTWERGKTFIPTIRKMIEDYGDLCNRPYDIERNGVAGDERTTYTLFPLDRDDKTLDDIPIETQPLLGKNGEGIVLQLTNDEMEDVLDKKYKLSGSSNSREERGGRSRGSERESGRRSDREQLPERGSSRGSSDRESSRGADRGSSERGASERGAGSRREKSKEDIF
jgi:hypothetical protein